MSWAAGSPRWTGWDRRHCGWIAWSSGYGVARTATYIQQLLSGLGPRVTRLARGLPMGGDLEYVDGVTLAHALSARQEVS